jgi:hypothetical protein
MSTDYPNIRPSLLLDFANTKKLDPRITFTRTTTATYYDGVTTAKAEQNLLLQSQDFTTTWTNVRSTDVANTDIAPDGTTTADSLLQASGQTTYGGVTQNATVVAGDYVLSVFAKPNGKNFLVILEQLLDGTSKVTWFNVSTGTIGTTNAGHTATISAAANSYYRCSIKFTANASRTAAVIFYVADTDGSTVVTDSGGLFIWGAQLEQRSSVTSYTATTTQPITNYIPVLLTAASGVPRFDHNPTTDESLGLLVEEQRTNLLTYSAEFADASWNKTRASITSNTIVAPDGTLTGDKLVEDTTASNTHFTSSSISFTSGTAYTYSIYAKQSEANRYLQIELSSAAFGSNLRATFYVSAGTVTTNGGSASIAPVGNGWYRCVFTATATATASATVYQTLANTYAASLAAITYTGDGYSGIFIWGAQLEAGAFPTSYIATTAATVTRNADSARMTGSNFTSWYSAAEGTVYTEASKFANAGAGLIWSIDDGTASNRMGIVFSTATQARYRSVTNGTTDVSIDTTVSADAFVKYASAYKVNDFAISINGAAASTDTSALVPTVSQIGIGQQFGAGFINGTIKKIAYYPLRVTNAQLQALTS